MIQAAASTLSVDHSKVAGKAHGASAKSSEAGSFSAILGNSDSAAAASSDTSATPAGEPAALAEAVAVGKPGKASGKTLPVAAKDKAGKSKSDVDTDTETSADSDSDPSEADVAAASVPFTLAGMQPLPLPPLSGTTPVTNTRSRTADSGITTTEATTARTLPETATAAAVGIPNSSASDRALAVLGLASTAAEARKALDGNQATQATSTVSAQPDATTDLPTSATNVAIDEQAKTTIKLGPIQVVPAPTPATATQLATRITPTAAQLIATKPGQATSAAGTQPAGLTTAAKQADATNPAQTPQVPAPSVADSKLRAANRQQAVASAEPAVEADAPVAKARIAETTPLPASPVPLVADAVQAQTTATPAVNTDARGIQGTSSVQGPQDFATLVSRLNEAREAASPQLVRTAISHSEFGQISLQFRHEDNALSVTMTNSDPGFASAVQAAANASLAGGTSGNSDNASQNQQQQHQQQHASTSSQQQAAAGGAGAGGGNGQNQQARADQAGQTMNRGQGTASRPQDQDASASRQDRDGTWRGGGIYA